MPNQITLFFSFITLLSFLATASIIQNEHLENNANTEYNISDLFNFHQTQNITKRDQEFIYGSIEKGELVFKWKKSISSFDINYQVKALRIGRILLSSWYHLAVERNQDLATYRPFRHQRTTFSTFKWIPLQFGYLPYALIQHEITFYPNYQNYHGDALKGLINNILDTFQSLQSGRNIHDFLEILVLERDLDTRIVKCVFKTVGILSERRLAEPVSWMKEQNLPTTIIDSRELYELPDDNAWDNSVEPVRNKIPFFHWL